MLALHNRIVSVGQLHNYNIHTPVTFFSHARLQRKIKEVCAQAKSSVLIRVKL